MKFPIERFSKDECGVIYYGIGAHFGEAQSLSTKQVYFGEIVKHGAYFNEQH